jgi:hypothetical protein
MLILELHGETDLFLVLGTNLRHFPAGKQD